MQEDNTKCHSDTRSLLEQIGIDPRFFEWQQLAACDGMPTNMFFEDYEGDPFNANSVDQLCLTCPVAQECFKLGVDTKSTGTFGGFYLVNGVPNSTRNSHKSKETAQRLAAKVFAT